MWLPFSSLNDEVVATSTFLSLKDIAGINA
jgi:hypothetical protein